MGASGPLETFNRTHHSFPQDLRQGLGSVCRWICLVTRAPKWRAGPGSVSTSSGGAGGRLSAQIRHLRHTRRLGCPSPPGSPSGGPPPSPTLEELSTEPTAQAPREPNCLLATRWGGLFSRFAPPSPFRLYSKELPRCPLAGGSCRSPSSLRSFYIHDDVRPCVTKPLPPSKGSSAQGRRRSLSAPSQWGAEGEPKGTKAATPRA